MTSITKRDFLKTAPLVVPATVLGGVAGGLALPALAHGKGNGCSYRIDRFQLKTVENGECEVHGIIVPEDQVNDFITVYNNGDKEKIIRIKTEEKQFKEIISVLIDDHSNEIKYPAKVFDGSIALGAAKDPIEKIYKKLNPNNSAWKGTKISKIEAGEFYKKLTPNPHGTAWERTGIYKSEVKEIHERLGFGDLSWGDARINEFEFGEVFKKQISQGSAWTIIEVGSDKVEEIYNKLNEKVKKLREGHPLVYSILHYMLILGIRYPALSVPGGFLILFSLAIR